MCISPLNSLMMDQHTRFSLRGLSTEFIGEAQTDPSVCGKVLRGEVQLVFITPENLIENLTYRKMLLSSRYKDRLVVLVVDESHCVKLDQFRKAFALIGSFRSLLPSGVPVLAHTVTALMDTYQEVLKRLSMKNPNLIALPPDRSNIVYSLHPMATLQDLGDSLYQDFAGKDVFPKTVLFVHKYKDCSDIYSTLLHKLGHNFTHPPGYPNRSEFRVS